MPEFDHGTTVIVKTVGGAHFGMVVIDPDWGRFLLASRLMVEPLAATFLKRLELSIGRVRAGIWDEVMCGMLDPSPGNVVWTGFRIKQQWFMETFIAHPMEKYRPFSCGDLVDGEWGHQRVLIVEVR